MCGTCKVFRYGLFSKCYATQQDLLALFHGRQAFMLYFSESVSCCGLDVQKVLLQAPFFLEPLS